MGRTPLRALNTSVSSESIEVPEGQPVRECRAPSIPMVFTCTGSADAPSTMTSRSAPVRPVRASWHCRWPRWQGSLWLRPASAIARRRSPPGCRCNGARRACAPAARCPCTCDSHAAETHPRGELHAQVAESADAEDRNQIRRMRPLFRRAFNVVMPARTRGAASTAVSPSGMRAIASNGTVTYSA